MAPLTKYLDALIKKKGLKSDSELANFLNLSRQAISRTRRDALLGESKCLIIARELDLNPLEIFSLVQAHKALSDESREIWVELHYKTKGLDPSTKFM